MPLDAPVTMTVLLAFDTVFSFRGTDADTTGRLVIGAKKIERYRRGWK
jgi:hypothetical protein